MAGRDRRRRALAPLATSSSSSSSSGSGSGTRALEHERWPRSPAWSDSGRRSSSSASASAFALRSLFRSIGLWFSSLTVSTSASSSMKRRTAPAGDAAANTKPPPPPPLPAGTTTKPSARGLYAAAAAGSGRQQRPSSSSPFQFQSSVFSLEQILAATSNFSPSLKIGQGGFGAVYKGVLPDGTVVAVKRAKQRMQNPHVDVEFRSEVKIMARIEHQSLVRFYGYLECGEERIVVVEFVPNGTLRDHLDRSNGRFLDFGTRLDIAIDVAHAVTYLHMYSDHPIIHRDIKSSNILLTHSLRAKVADFGFARLGAGGGLGSGEHATATHVTTQVKGTAGYLDPEYLKTCQLTDRSDVYSFGVLLVELASARRPIETKRDMKERLTARWAMARYIAGAAADVLDPHLPRTTAAERALEMLLDLAFRCVGPVRQDRPAMSDCCRALWAIRKKYRDMLSADVTPPPQFSDRATTATTTTTSSGDLWRI